LLQPFHDWFVAEKPGAVEKIDHILRSRLRVQNVQLLYQFNDSGFFAVDVIESILNGTSIGAEWMLVFMSVLSVCGVA